MGQLVIGTDNEILKRLVRIELSGLNGFRAGLHYDRLRRGFYFHIIVDDKLAINRGSGYFFENIADKTRIGAGYIALCHIILDLHCNGVV